MPRGRTRSPLRCLPPPSSSGEAPEAPAPTASEPPPNLKATPARDGPTPDFLRRLSSSITSRTVSVPSPPMPMAVRLTRAERLERAAATAQGRGPPGLKPAELGELLTLHQAEPQRWTPAQLAARFALPDSAAVAEAVAHTAGPVMFEVPAGKGRRRMVGVWPGTTPDDAGN